MGYEYLIAGLPELKASEKAPMSMEALEEQLQELLSDADLEQLRLMKVPARNGACRFVLDWLDFNRDMNNILTAEICKKHGFNLEKNIIGTFPDDVDPEVKALSRIENLYDRERAQDALRFAWLEERTKSSTFSLENVLAYYLELEMLNRWEVLTNEKGEAVFRQMVSEMKKGIQF